LNAGKVIGKIEFTADTEVNSVRALILYSEDGKLLNLVKGLERGLQAVGYEVQLLGASTAIRNINIPLVSYDLVCVGSPVVGFFGGEIAADIDAALKKTTRMQGKPTAAFVRPRIFGSTRSLHTLMKAMEAQGAWVQDFASVSTAREAEALGRRLETMQKL
jgi:hypothetical protein